MVKSTIYKGIEFVRLSSLSKSEQELFQKTFNPNLFIKILIGEEIVHDCIQYKDYVTWFAASYPEGTTAIAHRNEEFQEETVLSN